MKWQNTEERDRRHVHVTVQL